jgi:hypothetical protein
MPNSTEIRLFLFIKAEVYEMYKAEVTGLYNEGLEKMGYRWFPIKRLLSFGIHYIRIVQFVRMLMCLVNVLYVEKLIDYGNQQAVSKFIRRFRRLT